MQTATVVPSPSPTAKMAIRADVRAARMAFVRSLDGATRSMLETALAGALAPLWSEAKIIAGYSPMRDEIDPASALEAARRAGCTIALPAFATRDSGMGFHAGDALEVGPWGIRQPDPASPPLAPDLLLIPCVAVDRVGHRVGQGKGHYDRALAALQAAGRVRLIGIGWAWQRIEGPIDADPWDVPLDGFASPEGLEIFA